MSGSEDDAGNAYAAFVGGTFSVAQRGVVGWSAFAIESAIVACEDDGCVLVETELLEFGA